MSETAGINALSSICSCVLISACATSNPFDTPAHYDHMVGGQLSAHLYADKRTLKVVAVGDGVEEVEIKNARDCVVVFGVHKATDIIKYYRITSDPKLCYTNSQPLNWNR